MSKRYFQQPVGRPPSQHPAGPPPTSTFWTHAPLPPSRPEDKLPTSDEPLHSDNARPFTGSNGGPPQSEMVKRTYQPQALGFQADQQDSGVADSLETPKASSSMQPDSTGFRFDPNGKIIIRGWMPGTVSQALDVSKSPMSRDSIEYRSTKNRVDDHVSPLNRPTIEQRLEPPFTPTTLRAPASPSSDQLSRSLTQRTVPSHINAGPRGAPIQTLYGNLAMYNENMSRQLQGAHSQCLRLQHAMEKLQDAVRDRDQIICIKEAEAAHTGEQMKKLQDEKSAVEASLSSTVSRSNKLHTDQEEMARTRQLQVTALQRELDLKQDELAAEKDARNQLRVTLDGIQKRIEAGKEAVSVLNHLRMESQATNHELASVKSALVQARVEMKETNIQRIAAGRSSIRISEKLRDIETTISTLLAAIASQLKSLETGVLKAPITILEVLDTIQSLQTLCSSRSDQLSHATSELASERARNSDLQGRVEQLERLASDVDGLDEEVGALQSSALLKWKTKLAERDRDARSWEEALQKLSSDMELRNIQLQSRAEEINSLQVLSEELKSEKVKLSAALTVTEGEKANLQKLLDSKEAESKKIQSTTGHQQELQRLRDQITGSDQREKVANSKLRDTVVELEDTRRRLKEMSGTEMSDIRSPLERYQANELTLEETALVSQLQEEGKRQQAFLVTKLKETENEAKLSHDRCAKLENRVSTYMTLVDDLSKRDKTQEGISPSNTGQEISDPKRTLPLGSPSPDSIRSFPATQEGHSIEQGSAENSSRRDLGKRRFETLESLTEEPDDKPTKNSKAMVSSSTTRKHTLRRASMGSDESVVPPIATQNPEKIGKARGGVRSTVRFADKN